MNDAPVLFVARYDARPGTDAIEGWDAVMVCAAFERRTTVLLLDNAVALLSGANGAALATAMEAGVAALCVEAAALVARAMPAPGVELRCQLLDHSAIRALIAAHPVVISI